MIMKTKILLISVAGFLFFFVQLAYSAPFVYMDFDGNSATAETAWSVNLGDPFSVDIYASNFVDTLNSEHGGLIGFDLMASYDPTIAAVDSAVVVPPWAILPFSVMSSPGSVSMDGLYFASLPIPGLPTNTPLLLGTIDFSSKAEGIMDLDLSDRATDQWVGLDGFVFDGLITFQGAQVSVNAVPIPGAIWLFGAGVTALLGLRTRREKSVFTTGR
jgi:hypothetical protein